MSVLLVGIGGGTASGKSTFAGQLLARGGTDVVALLELDWYYRDRGHVPRAARDAINYDHPGSVEFELLIEHLRRLGNGLAVDCPQYDFSEHTRYADRFVRVDPKPVILLEGILALAVPELRQELNFKVFVDAPEGVRLARRVARDVQERGRTKESVLNQWNSTVQPMYELYCQPSKGFADQTIDGTSWGSADVEAVWSEVLRRRDLRAQS